MNEVRSKSEIIDQIVEIEARLKTLDDAIQAEVRRPYLERRRKVCQFLDLEKRTHSAILKQLKWMIYE